MTDGEQAAILIWAASVLCDMKNRGTNDIPRELKFQPYDLLKAIGRSTGGKDYAQLRDSLERLKTTAVTTNNPAPKPSHRPRPLPPRAITATADLPLLTPIIRVLSDRTIEQIRKEFSGWDIYVLQAAFNEWLDEDQSRTPKNYEAAFYGWVRQHHARNRSQVS